jgi:hypothetical protein
MPRSARHLARDRDYHSRERTSLTGAPKSWRRSARQYASDRELRVTLSDTLQFRALSNCENPNEAVAEAGRPEKRRSALNRLLLLLHQT